MFAEMLSEQLGDRLDVQFYHSARLFRDRDVIRAITRGDLEMAVPGTWQLDHYVPEIGYLLTPEFFGADSSDIDDFFGTDGGREIIRRIEYNLNVVVPGLWMDLGSVHIFTSEKQIQKTDDFRGLKLRVAGGIANKKRVEIFGADGVIIPWPDLRQRITDGSIDGLLTSFETVRSAELWNLGIKYVYADSEYFAQYVPIVSVYFWDELTEDERGIFTEIWNGISLIQRLNATEAQRSAKEEAETNGIIITYPSGNEIKKAEELLKSHENEILKELRLAPEVVDLLQTE